MHSEIITKVNDYRFPHLISGLVAVSSSWKIHQHNVFQKILGVWHLDGHILHKWPVMYLGWFRLFPMYFSFASYVAGNLCRELSGLSKNVILFLSHTLPLYNFLVYLKESMAIMHFMLFVMMFIKFRGSNGNILDPTWISDCKKDPV